MADEEDIALASLNSFLASAKAGKLTSIENHTSIWKMLLTIGRRQAASHVQRETAQKRGGGQVRGDSIFHAAQQSDTAVGFDRIPVSDDGPLDFENSDWVQRVLAWLDERGMTMLKKIAVWNSEGRTDEWIARRLGCSKKTVQRRLARLREIVAALPR